jgi:hypothetical protein
MWGNILSHIGVHHTNDDLIIVVGTREKCRILDAYEKHFGSGYPNSIVTTRKGKQVSTASDLQLLNKRMRPFKDKYYWVETLELHCIIVTLLRISDRTFSYKIFITSASCAKHSHR